MQLSRTSGKDGDINQLVTRGELSQLQRDATTVFFAAQLLVRIECRDVIVADDEWSCHNGFINHFLGRPQTHASFTHANVSLVNIPIRNIATYALYISPKPNILFK